MNTIDPEAAFLWRGLEQSFRIKLCWLKTLSVGRMIVGLHILYLLGNTFRPSPWQLKLKAHWQWSYKPCVVVWIWPCSQGTIILAAQGRWSLTAIQTTQSIHHTRSHVLFCKDFHATAWFVVLRVLFLINQSCFKNMLQTSAHTVSRSSKYFHQSKHTQEERDVWVL